MAKIKPVPAKRDKTLTQTAILDAAEKQFSAKGFAGASMREISSDAKVNQSLIHHHFDTKQNLWRAVCSRKSKQYLDAQYETLGRSDVTLEMLIDAFVRDFTFWRKDPSSLRLQSWAALEGNNPYGDERSVMSAPFIPVIEALQKKGVIRKDISALNLLALCAASVHFWLIHRTEICEDNDIKPTKKIDDAFLKDTITVIFNGGVCG